MQWAPHALAMTLHRDKDWVSGIEDDHEDGVRLYLGNRPVPRTYVHLREGPEAERAREQQHNAWLLIERAPPSILFTAHSDPESDPLGPEWRP